MSTRQNDPNRKCFSLGLDENVAGFLSYAAGFLSGIVFLLLEKESSFIRFHAKQSILLSVAYIILFFILGIIPVIGWILYIIITPIALTLWIALMLKAYRHEYIKLPIIGHMAEK